MERERKVFGAKAQGIAAGVLLLGAVAIIAVALFFLSDIPNSSNTFSGAPLEKFKDYSNLKSYFETAQSAGYGSNGYYAREMAVPMMGNVKTTSASSDSTAGASQSASSYSATNVQVAGVDEADIVKNDGKYIYSIAQGTLFIVDAFPAEQAKIVSKLDLNNQSPISLFISNDSSKLLVFSSEYSNGPIYYAAGATADAKPMAGGMMGVAVDSMPSRMPIYWNQGMVSARIYNISDKSNPVLEKEVSFEGSLLDARLVGSTAYFVVNASPRWYGYGVDQNSNDENGIIPLMRIDGVESKVAAPQDIAIMPRVYPQAFITVASINLSSGDLQKETIVGSAQNLYSSADNLYLADAQWSYYLRDSNSPIPEPLGALARTIYYPIWGSVQKTVIAKFHLQDGKASYSGEGSVPGSILNQFSMDEYNDHFRIATTVGETFAEPGSPNASKNNVYVLDKDMNVVGSLEGLAPSERIYSARFLGDKGYLVTFKNIDPLFVLDLSDPSNPKLLGKLKIPGYSDYLQPIDETHLLGIGKDVNELFDADKVHSYGSVYYTAVKGVKMAIFDVSDVEHPVELHKFVIGDAGTDSEALTDHKALLFDKDRGILVLPITIVEVVNSGPSDPNAYVMTDQTFQGAVVLNVSLSDGFSERGRITHVSSEEEAKRGFYYDYDSRIRRSLYMDNVLYTLSEKMIKGNDLSTLSELGSVTFPVTSSPPYGYPYPARAIE